MNSKKIIIATFSLLLCALFVVGAINVVIDPLFQYHKPWFGLEPVVINDRYQNAGIAKNFDFENVIIGNSYSENFLVSDVENLFDGKTVKLTASGSHFLDWSYVLSILENRKRQPENILFNLDPSYIVFSTKETKHELPEYLYDYNYLNDVEYLFNFTLTRKYTLGALEANLSDAIPDYNTLFMWDGENVCGKENVLKSYNAGDEENNDVKEAIFYTEDNLKLIGKYFESMPDTEFVFFYSPFSILYWKDRCDQGVLDDYKKEMEKTFKCLSEYENVTVYFWTDSDMLNIISDLDNYRDTTHYGMHISKEIVRRMDAGIGVLPKDEKLWKAELNSFFDYLENYDYDTIFQ